MSISYDAVSYTHLDVYKRQSLHCRLQVAMLMLSTPKAAVFSTMTQTDNPVPNCGLLPEQQYCSADHEEPLLLHEEQLIFPDHSSQLSSADIIEPIKMSSSTDSIIAVSYTHLDVYKRQV